MKNISVISLLLFLWGGNAFAVTVTTAPEITSMDIGDWGIQMEFDQPMQTWHEKVTVDYIRITPEVACEWYWQDDTALMCRTPRDSAAIKPFSYYQVEILGGLLSQQGIEIKATSRIIHADNPGISASITGWISGKPKIVLHPSEGVEPAAIQQVLSLKQDERQIAYRLKKIEDSDEEDSDEEDLAYELEYAPMDVVEGLLSLSVVPGLRSTSGPVPGEQNSEIFSANIEPFELREINCNSLNVQTKLVTPFEKPGVVFCDPERAMTLAFSEALDAASVAALQKSLPPGFTMKAEEMSNYWGYKSPRTAPPAIYAITSSLANSHYDLPLTASVHSISGRTLKTLPALSLATGDFLARASLSPRRRLLLPGEEDKTKLSTINRDEKRIKFEGFNIGNELELDRQTIRLATRKNHTQSFDLNGASPEVQENGGLYWLETRTDSLKSLQYQRLFAPFNTLIGRKDDQVLVWATEWQSGASIPGAKVELLLLDTTRQLHVIGSGTTGEDGVAMLVAKLEDGMNSKWKALARVSKNGKTVVQELDENYAGKLDFKERSYEGNTWKPKIKKEMAIFGVTELPLYRPGETVKYRIWLRSRLGNRLKLPVYDKALKVELFDDNDNSLQAEEAKFDANGSFSGEIKLSSLLNDGLYCVSPTGLVELDHNYGEGACFEIARFEAQPLWAELKSDQSTLLLGQKMNLSLESGFFSGGAAADVTLVYSGLASSQRFEETYPEFSGFTFTGSRRDDEKGESNPFHKLKTPQKTDAKGKSRLVFSYVAPVKDDNDEETTIAFGTFEMNVEVRIPGKAASSSNTVTTRFSQYERFVGLKTRSWWLSLGQDPGLEAVVADYQGKAISDVPVTISIFLIEGKNETPVGECILASGRKTPCSYKPAKAGRYLFKASSKDAAGAELSRYAGSGWARNEDEDAPVADLQLVKASDGISAAEVRLIQPYEHANVLFTLEYDSIVHHWVQRIDNNDTTLSIPVKREWAPGATLRAVVRPADQKNAIEAGRINTLDATLKLVIPGVRNDDLLVTTDRNTYKPGETVSLTLRNESTKTRYITVSVLDDSVYQQGMSVRSAQSPDNESFLGKLEKWSNPDWYGLDTWPKTASMQDGFVDGAYEIGTVRVLGSKIKRTVEEEGAQPVQILTRADIERSGLNNVYEVLNKITASDGSGLSTVSTETNGDPKEIDYIRVTGSKISAADAFQRTEAIHRELKRQENRNGKTLPHVRSLFRDAIYWNPDLVLAPGESKTVSVKLSDNLTRWRVLAWSSDDADGFAQYQASFETSLPIEVRSGLPGQLFVGDQASAQITARNQQKKQLIMSLTSALSGAGVGLSKAVQGKVSPYASLSQSLEFTVRAEGPLDLLSIADTTKDSDGVSTSVNVLSRMGTEALPQSGWLDEAMLRLTLPTLQTSAVHPELELTVHQGFKDWTDGWLRDLQDYPHRCWEQTLSRAIGAAYSGRYGESAEWPDRSTVIMDALQAAPSFQDENGYFRYFRTEKPESNSPPSYALSAYTLKGLDYLSSLSVKTPGALRNELEGQLADVFKTATRLDKNGNPVIPYETAATIAGALGKEKQLDADTLEALWQQWESISWYARSELLLAMSRKPEFASRVQEGITRLQQAGTQHGLRRVLHDDRDFSFYMGSGLRDQCAVTSALWQLDKSESGLPIRKAMLRGVYDLYAGGTPSLDTQSSAQCLMGLHAVTAAMPKRDGNLQVKAELGTGAHDIVLSGQQAQAGFKQAIDANTRKLNIASSDALDGSVHYNAVVRYQYDMRDAKAKGTGLLIRRHYDVLRSGAWVSVEKSAVVEGDWIRVRLTVIAPQERHFVAVTDIVPGGLVSRDIGLSSVGSAQLQKIGGDGSYYFAERQTMADAVRIYAQTLPAGEHVIYYYAQAVHPGDYFAPPAVAELMYGRSSRANTIADRVTVRASK